MSTWAVIMFIVLFVIISNILVGGITYRRAKDKFTGISIKEKDILQDIPFYVADGFNCGYIAFFYPDYPDRRKCYCRYILPRDHALLSANWYIKERGDYFYYHTVKMVKVGKVRMGGFSTKTNQQQPKSGLHGFLKFVSLKFHKKKAAKENPLKQI